MPPARANLSLYVTGVTGPIGAAAAMGRVMGFDERRMRWAIGHAATQGAGFRATHGAMSGLVVPAYAARAGLFAAHLAATGVECAEDVLEAPKGFVEIFSSGADLGHATDGLGERFEIMANAYKPYPCGIVVHPAIDACRAVALQLEDAGAVQKIRLHVHPLAMQLANRPHPKDMFEAQVSISHWAAAVFVLGATGIAVVRHDAIDDQAVAAFRDRVSVIADPGLERDQARAEAVLPDDRTISALVEHARGSVDRPMSDDELDGKFLAQCEMIFDAARARPLLDVMRDLAAHQDIGAEIGRLVDDRDQGNHARFHDGELRADASA
jgi:2-methylcitrate dehydratase PrpD